MCDYYIIVVPLIHYTYEKFNCDRMDSFVVTIKTPLMATMCDYYIIVEPLIHYTYEKFSGDRTDSFVVTIKTPLMATMCDYYIIVVPLIHYKYEKFSGDRTGSFVMTVLKTHHRWQLCVTTILLLSHLCTIHMKCLVVTERIVLLAQ